MSRLPTDRRTLLKAGLAAPIALQVDSAAAVSLDLTMFGPGRLFADVQSYAEAGNKQSGGAGDRWTADWTAKRLFSAGFEVDRQTFDVPWFEASHCELTLGDHTIPLVAQPLADALARGANGVILITTGPTGEALLLNVPAGHPVSDKPLALLAPRLAAPVIEAARHGAAAKLALRGRGGIRAAQNIIGRRVRSGRPWLVVSTPRSGWTDCAGERGPGIAMWLALADWMPRAFPQHSLLFLCNSGHEYENLGASHIADKVGPAPGETAFWFHLGANAAARDYQEMPGRLLPLPSADPYRFLMTSPEFVTCAREIFKGQPGLEMAYPSAEGTAGELSEVIKAGYVRHAGIFGAHRHHHAVTDDLSTVTPDPLAATARGVRDLLSAVVS